LWTGIFFSFQFFDIENLENLLKLVTFTLGEKKKKKPPHVFGGKRQNFSLEKITLGT
jgi:hypothetical protein